MHELLPIDVALWSALIIVAAFIIIRRRRGSRRSRRPTGSPRRGAAEQRGPRGDAAQQGGPRGDAAEQGGPRRDAAEQGGPRRDAAEQAGEKVPPRKAPLGGNGDGPGEPQRSTPRPARAAPTAPRQAAEATAGSRRPATQRAGRQAHTRAAAPSEPIARFYDQADQPIADYLAALGWAQEPLAPPGRETGADGDSAAEPPGGRPAP